MVVAISLAPLETPNFKCNGRAKAGLSFFGTTSRARR